MRVVQADRLDSLEEYAAIEAPTPTPSATEVRIKVAACGVGYVDALVALGRYQVKPPLPHVPGAEVAGHIDAVGADVRDVAVGDRVMAQVRGGFAEYAIAPAAAVNRIPDNLTFERAAGFRTNYLTALHGLRDRAHLAAGERLLVIGAAGGVGLAAVQIGRLMGATVIAVASSPEKRALTVQHGADITLDREVDGWRDRLKAAAGGGIDVVFDPVCGPLFQPAFRSLNWGGRHLVVGFVGGPIPALPANLPLMKGAALVGVDVRQFAQVFEADKAKAQVQELLGWVRDDRLAPPVGRVFPFAQYREALSFAFSGQGVAKTVLAVG
ncbi:NADPH:quinone oxidoreductase family protein [Reyranella sp. CPCC 100927]|uniref:NADPH:quinone oxidoreductase family protein n=1 Tax=Reyranella sp. CPCC 100927 TaxID=2599616 RepID=UPI0011B55085|nr:NADPH:quinone oxidoreductase family protein [Reyranella sp. CPCC 100927]TWT09464.1 NADPH:quinone oxidoreductase family protein [Reyranella sp. CPCC 100927]